MCLKTDLQEGIRSTASLYSQTDMAKRSHLRSNSTNKIIELFIKLSSMKINLKGMTFFGHG